MIKYLGSKRRLVPHLGRIARAVGARSTLDLFTGTTRVAQEFKRLGASVTAVDTASYAEAFGRCYLTTDADAVDLADLGSLLADLQETPGHDGYVTETFCRRARYFQPHNGMRIDAIRDRIEEEYAESVLHPVLLTSLVEAADRVDSTTGLQMAFLKDWSDRSAQPLRLRMPELLPGTGTMLRADAMSAVDRLAPVDLAYLDPPYNQHRYFTNYHVWETLVRWDAPAHYGVACKRVDAREESTKSVFNRKGQMAGALVDLLGRVRAEVVVVSCNDESWVSPDEVLTALRSGHEHCAVLAFDTRRYVGAQIGVFNGRGVRVGSPRRLHNLEFLFVAGPRAKVAAAIEATDNGSTANGSTANGAPGTDAPALQR